MSASCNQIVTFRVGQELFGLSVMDVNEIILPENIQAITTSDTARSPVIGVIHLRGDVVTVVDFRKLLGKTAHEEPQKGRIIILSGTGLSVGLLVDHVEQVTGTQHMAFETPPNDVTEYVYSIAKSNRTDALVYMIETERLRTKVGGDARDDG